MFWERNKILKDSISKYRDLINNELDLLLNRIEEKNNSIKRICIKYREEKGKKYPYNTSKYIRKRLRKKLGNKFPETKVTYLNVEFKNKQDQENYKLLKINTSSEPEEEKSDLTEFYVPKYVIDSELVIVLVNPRRHQHHFRKFIYDHRVELLSMSFTNLKIPELMKFKEYLTLIENDLDEYLHQMELLYMGKNIVYLYDQRFILHTNEHSFFQKLEEQGRLYFVI